MKSSRICLILAYAILAIDATGCDNCQDAVPPPD